jgi:Mrp family chromosome partitioning ATPase/uncharacterized protein involved in exopolysaccharide biosynthesis
MVMKPESQVVEVSRVPSALEGWPSAAAAPVAVESPLAKLHARLKGRYIWAVLLALIGAILGGLWGFRRGEVLYKTNPGKIRVEASLPMLLVPTERSAPMPMYDRFIGGQMDIMKSDVVLTAALAEPVWRGVDRLGGPMDVHTLGTGLTINNPPSTDLIEITFEDQQASVAHAAVLSVMSAYEQWYEQDDKKADRKVLDELYKHRTDIESDLVKKNDDIQRVAKRYGTDVLTTLYEDKLRRLGTLEDLWRQTSWVLQAKNASMQAAATQPGQSSQSLVGRVESPDEIAKAGDAQMTQYLQDRRTAEQNLRLLRIHDAPNHPNVINAQKTLEAINKTIEDYAATYRKTYPNAIVPPGDVTPTITANGIAPVMTLPELIAREQRLHMLYDELAKETQDIGRDNLELNKLNAEAKNLKEQLDDTKRRILALEMDKGLPSRIEVISVPVLPLAPYSDSHYKRAAMGTAGGALAGFALVAMLGFVDRRFRRMDDVHRGIHGVPVLGMMPRLPGKGADTERAAVAIHCVHQLRTRLQVSADLVQPKVIAITSYSSGEGKTSLAMALALSFAGSNARALLMDFDVTGGHLSRRLEPIHRPKLGQVLLERRLIVQEQLDTALSAAAEAHVPLGQVLVENGIIDGQMLADALAAQAPAPGLPEALAGLPLVEAARPTKVPNLWLLHSGPTGSVHPGRVAPASLRRILDEAREHFDVVLVDTGPCPGSLEASLITPQVDAVVAVVSSGTREDEVAAMLAHLKLLKGHVAGVVFNRANIREARTYSRGHGTANTPAHFDDLAALGADTHAVHAEMRSTAGATSTTAQDPPSGPTRT